MSRGYNSFDQIAEDLKILKLRRQIAIEEFKLVKSEFKDDLSWSNWLDTAFRTLGKVGMLRLAKKIF